MTTSTEKTADLLRVVSADLAGVIGDVTEAQLHDPTPCTEFDVAQLRHHMLGWLATFAAGFADPNGQAAAGPDAYEVPVDAAAAVRTAADQLDRAVRAGAADRPLRLGGSAMPGDMALSMILWEYQVHGWDLARATGQAWSPPVAATLESLAFAPAMLTDDFQGQGKSFGPRVDVPHDASPLDRLLGVSGRDPRWSAR